MLVIEGAGRLGKTTAAQKLVAMAHARGFGQAEYRHMKRPSQTFNFGSDYWPMLCDYAVQDRFHLGGMAWHDQSETGLTDAKIRIINAKVRAIGGMIIVFTCKDEAWYTHQWLATQDHSKLGVTHQLDTQLAANRMFTHNLAWKHADLILEVNGDTGFVNDDQLGVFLDDWINRREFALCK